MTRLDAFYMINSSPDNYCADCTHDCHCTGDGVCKAGELEANRKTWETKTSNCKCTECKCKKMYTDPKWGESTVGME